MAALLFRMYMPVNSTSQILYSQFTSSSQLLVIVALYLDMKSTGAR